MGITELTARQQALVDKYNSLDKQAQEINEKKLEIAQQRDEIESLFSTNSINETEGKAAAEAAAEKEKANSEKIDVSQYESLLSNLDKLDNKLEDKLNKLEDQRKSIANELKSVKKQVDKNIFKSFVYNDGKADEGEKKTNKTKKK